MAPLCADRRPGVATRAANRPDRHVPSVIQLLTWSHRRYRAGSGELFKGTTRTFIHGFHVRRPDVVRRRRGRKLLTGWGEGTGVPGAGASRRGPGGDHRVLGVTWRTPVVSAGVQRQATVIRHDRSQSRYNRYR